MTPPDEPAWLGRALMLAIHAEQITEHGGAEGIRDDAGLLDSALARPVDHFAYAVACILELAALNALAIAHNHLFIDGNKRSAYVALELFLAKNGFRFAASDAKSAVMMLAMAAGEIDDAAFIAWVRQNAVPVSGP